MLKVIMTKGIPASGKTTWANEFIKENKNFKRVNKDDLRFMLDCGLWSKENEKFVLSIRDQIILKALRQGISVIVDDTNLETKHEHHIKYLLQLLANELNEQIAFQIKWFIIDKENAIWRDSNRTQGTVGKDVINKMYDKCLTQVHMDSYTVVTPEQKEVVNQNLPKAIIVDVDGTIAIRNNRGPFEWDKVSQDTPNFNVIDIVRTLYRSGFELIFLSGRDEICFDDTHKWIESNVLWGMPEVDFHLFMRTHDDMRADEIIKEELYNAHVKNQVCVYAVFDDRDKVVNMWRNKLRLLCLQVNYGDF